MSTTNGTRALERVRQVPILLTASLTNRAAVVRYLLQEQSHTAWIVAAGWRGSFSLEDTICAGAIACGFGLLVTGLRWRSRGSRDLVVRAGSGSACGRPDVDWRAALGKDRWRSPSASPSIGLNWRTGAANRPDLEKIA